MPYPRVCEECGNEFVPDYKDHTYCSSECAKGEPNMNTTKHTPGPWKAVPDKSRNMYTWYVEGAKGVVPTIARLSLIDACEEIESNAHLIAAAPAMYEALQQSLVLVELAALEEWGRAVRGEQQPPTTEAKDRLEKVKAALAQAEGRQA